MGTRCAWESKDIWKVSKSAGNQVRKFEIDAFFLPFEWQASKCPCFESKCRESNRYCVLLPCWGIRWLLLFETQERYFIAQIRSAWFGLGQYWTCVYLEVVLVHGSWGAWWDWVSGSDLVFECAVCAYFLHWADLPSPSSIPPPLHTLLTYTPNPLMLYHHLLRTNPELQIQPQISPGPNQIRQILFML